MPGGAAVLAALVTPPEASAVPRPVLLGLPAQYTSFNDVECASGYRCVSKISAFGLSHDGEYRRPSTEEVPARLKDAWEWNCPAKGKLGLGGHCEGGDRSAGYCFSGARFESGTDAPCGVGSEKCVCMRTSTDKGNPAMGNRSSEVENGEELIMGQFEVEPVPNCENCADNNKDPKICDQCERCEYTTKVAQMGEVKRKIAACFENPESKKRTAQDGKGRLFMNGQDPIGRDLIVVPHYHFWDPHEMAPLQKGKGKVENPVYRAGGMTMPYQSMTDLNDGVSVKEWRRLYAEDGAQLQRFMDRLYTKFKEWGENPSDLKCFSKEGTGGSDVQGKMEKWLFSQRECLTMQSIANKIAKGVKFKDHVNGHPVQCLKGASQGGGCEALNCYYDPKYSVSKFFNEIKDRNAECKAAQDAAQTQDGNLQAQAEEDGFEPPSPEAGAALLGALAHGRGVRERRRLPRRAALCEFLVACP